MRPIQTITVAVMLIVASCNKHDKIIRSQCFDSSQDLRNIICEFFDQFNDTNYMKLIQLEEINSDTIYLLLDLVPRDSLSLKMYTVICEDKIDAHSLYYVIRKCNFFVSNDKVQTTKQPIKLIEFCRWRLSEEADGSIRIDKCAEPLIRFSNTNMLKFEELPNVEDTLINNNQ